MSDKADKKRFDAQRARKRARRGLANDLDVRSEGKNRKAGGVSHERGRGQVGRRFRETRESFCILSSTCPLTIPVALEHVRPCKAQGRGQGQSGDYD